MARLSFTSLVRRLYIFLNMRVLWNPPKVTGKNVRNGLSNLSDSTWSRSIIVIILSNVLFLVYSQNSLLEWFPRSGSRAVTFADAEAFRVTAKLSNYYDPRLLPALWVNAVRHHLNGSATRWDSNLALPFSWASWLDSKGILESVDVKFDLHDLSCDNFGRLFKLSYDNFTSSCIDYSRAPHSYPSLKVNATVDLPMPEQARKIVGLLYLIYYSPIPSRLAFLGAGPEKSTILIPTVSAGKNALGKGDAKDLLHRYLAQSGREIRTHNNSINLQNEVIELSNQWKALLDSVSFVRDNEIVTDIFRVANNSWKDPDHLMSKEDFRFNYREFYQDLHDKVEVSNNKSQINDFDRSLLTSVTNEIGYHPNFTKYFHEASIIGTQRGSHYDWRFFRKLEYSDYEKKAIFHRLSRAWLRFCNSLGITTWLAHGTLLGWYWNGMNMPWDSDLDVQITMDSLSRLARNYNNTLIADLSSDNGLNLGVGTYLLDVNPNFFSREKGNGLNTIDARFIDTSSGFYVDITGLALTDAANNVSLSSKKSFEFNQVIDPEFLEKEKSETIIKDHLYEELSAKISSLHNDSSIYNCRNNHFYTFDNLHPLRQTLFEGVLAYIPNEYSDILKREYRRGLYYKEFEDHTFRPVLDLWVPSNICKRDTIGNRCFDKEVLLEANSARPMTSRHREEMSITRRNKNGYSQIEELNSCQIDPWIIERSKIIESIIKS
ncbi:regulator of cell wall mannosyl phosphorylation [Scheffersomyces xylosifermentans]|uniref:regulator of cell wall mannosyl phosphorylation n=1 Tax=Scheffersomyces xylosifermentans TaxID=1304137 RepID=UPI00315D87FB